MLESEYQTCKHFKFRWLVGLWCLTQRSTIFQLYLGGGGNRSTLRKPPTCRKSPTNFIILCCIGGNFARNEIRTLNFSGDRH